jgi:hypothetical protein
VLWAMCLVAPVDHLRSLRETRYTDVLQFFQRLQRRNYAR